MAKLLAARVAWAAADNAVQIHGGNGFAVEFPISRILCDARILNIFEGAAEIQANVIARRLLDGSNGWEEAPGLTAIFTFSECRPMDTLVASTLAKKPATRFGDRLGCALPRLC